MSRPGIAAEIFRTQAARRLAAAMPVTTLPIFTSFPGIEQRLAVQTPLSTPHLWAASAEEATVQLGSAEPFYACLWPGSYALCSLINAQPEIVRGKSVLDFGAGCGSAGLAALTQGASHVELNDIDTNALSACCENLHENMQARDAAGWEQRVSLSSRNLLPEAPEDWAAQSPAIPACDVLLCGDVFYDEDFARGVQRMLLRALSSGAQVLVADPGRPALPGAARLALGGAHEATEAGTCMWEHAYTVDLPDNVRCVSNGHPECHVWQLRLAAPTSGKV